MVFKNERGPVQVFGSPLLGLRGGPPAVPAAQARGFGFWGLGFRIQESTYKSLIGGLVAPLKEPENPKAQAPGGG